VNIYYSTDAAPSSPDTSDIAARIAAYLEPYSDPADGQREVHLRELCLLGEELRGLMESHPSDWRFGSWDAPGFIMLAPALLKDRQQIVDRQIFRRI